MIFDKIKLVYYIFIISYKYMNINLKSAPYWMNGVFELTDCIGFIRGLTGEVLDY